jgi:proteasome lid subunit RPN8/RPN11
VSSGWLQLAPGLLEELARLGEGAYPEEGVALLAGRETAGVRHLLRAIQVGNAGAAAERQRRYRIAPNEYVGAELAAARSGLELLGVFHSHPDHPAVPSETDRAWAWPWFTYLIMRVDAGRAGECRAWRLQEDRTGFREEDLRLPKETRNADR